MEIQERLQHTIGFIKQAPASTEAQLIGYLVSVGDTEEDATNAIPLYLGMMVQFGYLTEPTYEAMRDWGNSHTVEQITVATSAMLAAYEDLKKKEAKVAKLQAEIQELEAQIANIDGSTVDLADLIVYYEEGEGKFGLQEQVEALKQELHGYNI